MADSGKLTLERASKGLVNHLAAIIRTSQIHDPSNVAVLKALDKFASVINALLSTEEAVSIELIGDYFYVNESRVKLSMDQLINFDYLMKEFRKLMLGGVSFLDRVTPGDMQVFLRAFLSAPLSAAPFKALSEAIKGIKGIAVETPRKLRDKPQEYDIRREVKSTYFSAVSFAKGVMNKLRAGEKINAKRSKRVVQSLVDVLLKEEELLTGMTAIKDYDDYTYHHSVNVSILSIALGQKLGFAKQTLLELGLVALFHDIGKIEIPPDVLNKPSSFTEDEWRVVRRHPYWGVRAILNMKGFDLVSIKAAIVTFEHHQRIDHGGYPPRKYASSLDLYSKIVSIADQYDGMTSARVYSRTPMNPEKALSLLRERAGIYIDPLLFKFFVNMVGVYPVGTAVVLDTKELALVYSNNIMSPLRPNVLIITDRDGRKVQGYREDLTEKLDTDRYRKSILKTLDPAKYKINLAEYLL